MHSSPPGVEGETSGAEVGLPGASASKCNHVAFVEAEASKRYGTAKITFEYLWAFDCRSSVGI